MKTLKITWLDSCSKCGFSEYAEVSTERGIGCLLFTGDKVRCPKCGHGGEIGVNLILHMLNGMSLRKNKKRIRRGEDDRSIIDRK